MQCADQDGGLDGGELEGQGLINLLYRMIRLREIVGHVVECEAQVLSFWGQGDANCPLLS